jgi:hypothetical protein
MNKFIKVTSNECPTTEILVNVREIEHISRRKDFSYTKITFTSQEYWNVNETPEELLVLINGTEKNVFDSDYLEGYRDWLKEPI